MMTTNNEKRNTKLYDKIFGCIAASNIGSSMGAMVETWDPERIKDKYGVLDRLEGYCHYGAYQRKPGTTEDGIERQRLLVSAIKEKGGRITAEDLREIWIRDINPEKFNVQMEPCDEILYKLAAAGMPAGNVGQYSDYMGIVSFARSCHPVGLINACNPHQAYVDTFDVGRLYQPLHGLGLDWATVLSAGIAEAMKPTATVDSVVDASLRYVHVKVRNEIERALEATKNCESIEDMKPWFYQHYNGVGTPYCYSMGNEIITKGVCLFYVGKGNPKDLVIGAVNFGRDTDCLAAVSSGLGGALSGASSLRQDWIDTVDDAMTTNEHTVSRRSLAEMADVVYDGVINERAKMQDQANAISELIK
ncbi:ADP-ribosylglycohydrolase family protein [Marinicrinis sediminis]|uniref:ADP-ribosylglycohydrolase family protein n=1 Tax=Marinicrinis sediminis TaxID=1652465 RepID=A0ABW5RAA0_9BACL